MIVRTSFPSFRSITRLRPFFPMATSRPWSLSRSCASSTFSADSHAAYSLCPESVLHAAGLFPTSGPYHNTHAHSAWDRRSGGEQRERDKQ